MPSLAPTTRLSSRFSRAFPCNLEQVRPATRAIREFLREEGATEEELMACELALVEACNNAVLYATDYGRAKPIRIEVQVEPDLFELRVIDHTEGFELPALKDLPPNESESGRGLFIIQSLMDDARYERNGSSNALILVKTRNAEAGSQPFDTYEDVRQKLQESEQIITDMAEELSSCYESLSAIFRCGAELGKTDNFKQFSTNLGNDLLQITEADWYVLRIASADQKELVTFSSTRQLNSLPLQPELAERGVVNSIASSELRAAYSRMDVWFDRNHPLSPDDPLHEFGAGFFGLVHPLYFGETLVGTLSVGKKAGKDHLTAAQANVVHTFGDFLAIQVVNSRLREEQIHSRLVSHELQIARNIQRSLLPKNIPEISGFGLAGTCESARQVGGDFYDIVPVGADGVLLVIADVMGKGVPAAMFAAILRGLFRAVPHLLTKPAGLLEHVNALMYQDLSDVEMFITAQVVYVNFRERTVTAANAGHCPLLIATQQSGEVQTVAPDGFPLGIMPQATFCNASTTLPPTGRLLLYTDGLTEAQNGKGEFFGQERLVEFFLEGAKAGHGAAEVKERLASKLKEFQGPSGLHDDQTFLVFCEESERQKTL
jgi:serine phosphatase RsbU (regulator of sigma subunit)/anti-sigma regulatory factor (Ser/Thr protein kinase)